MIPEIPSPEKLDRVIRAVAESAEILSGTSIADPEYRERARQFVKDVTVAASQHRNWNPLMISIDGMIDYSMDDELPANYRTPAVERDDYTGYEDCVEELFYLTTVVNLDAFKISDVYLIEKMMDVGSLFSYSTQWDIDRGVFRD